MPTDRTVLLQGFDVGVAAPILSKILGSEFQLEGKTALVPGCG